MYNRPIVNPNPALQTLPCLPDLKTTDRPPFVVPTCLVYNANGSYMGWNEYAEIKKFLYQKLWYKTKGAYTSETKFGKKLVVSGTKLKGRGPYKQRVSTTKFRKNSDDFTILIKEKATGLIALVIRSVVLAEKDLVDVTSRSEMAHYGLKQIQNVDFARYADELWKFGGLSHGDIPDQHKLLSSPAFFNPYNQAIDTFIAGFQKEYKVFCDSQKLMAVNYLNGIVEADRAIQNASSEHGIILDI